jgi:hypothetical protein
MMKLTTEQTVIIVEALRQQMYRYKDNHDFRMVRKVQAILDGIDAEMSEEFQTQDNPDHNKCGETYG